jgi:hypothetical protein
MMFDLELIADMLQIFNDWTQVYLLRYCDIPAQGLIVLIRILISISCKFFSGSPSLKTPKLSVLGLERWATDREVLPGCA